MSKSIVAKRRFVDRTGQQYSRLTVVEFSDTDRHGNARWQCLCECGESVIVNGHSLASGHTKSCGCFNRAATSERSFRHGECNSPEYFVWRSMNQRCTNPKDRSWRNYGGRGIRVCERWSSFEAFISDMGRRPTAKHQIDRIDNDGDYCPENCQWVTCRENNSHRRISIRIVWRGQEMCLAEVSRLTGVHYDTMRHRFKRGWTAHEIVYGR